MSNNVNSAQSKKDGLYDAIQPQLSGASAQEKKVPESSLFGVDILHVIKDAQSQHGLRHGDYQRYHGYCNRRLKRIRSFLKFKMGSSRKVTPKVVTQNIFTDPRYILMLLMTAERAWSFAMQLKQEANSDVRKRHHMVGRLRKSTKYANQLYSLCDTSPKVDARTKLEAQAYCSYMNGVLLFELKNWAAAMNEFNQSQTIYKKLSEALHKEEKSVYLNMVDDISPNIRYCAYTIGDDSAMDDLLQMHGSNRQDPLLAEKIDTLIAAARGSKAASVSEVQWRDHVIRVKNAKVRLFLIGVQEDDVKKEEGRQAKIEAYDRMLTECKDAIQLTRDDLRSDSKASGKDEVLSDLQLLSSYLNFIRLTCTVARNLLLVEDLQEVKKPGSKREAKPSEFVRLYDSITQSIVEMLGLDGIDPSLTKELTWQKVAFHAYRCYYVTQMLVAEKKWPQALALCDRVASRAKEALKTPPDVDWSAEHCFASLETFKEISDKVAALRCRIHAAAVLDEKSDELPEASGDDVTSPLMDRLDVYREDPALQSLEVGKPNQKVPPLSSSFPPTFQPVPHKPVFFDLALNHVSFPSLEGKLAPKPGQQQKAGLTGLISNLWSWGGKK